MSGSGWQRRLNDAATKEEVVAVANDFLAQWTPEDMALIPDDCQPHPMEDTDQINSYALKLARRDTIAPGHVSALHRMATFFTKAALRVFQIDDLFPPPGKHHNGRASQ